MVKYKERYGKIVKISGEIGMRYGKIVKKLVEVVKR